ncbi:uncharacterized protein LOC108674115 isoform X2 [Hyalella azteca]|uniref:Uncharacterized protein LOC108674115 isoform X1 n=1 Tax=Hyalella azteca TaxID=294128 RepID=A0A8B7NUU8_HYAAZ|nr:uncharacterized protein LOC108674115 isoform X1 [Hyalella azteca]XP_018017509.1 uncharacterized protein LOC108674115 isoform X2 [Hyalella azteca]
MRSRWCWMVMLVVVTYSPGGGASPAKKGHPKSIPHHAAHILTDPNHNSPRLLTMPSAQHLTHGAFPLSHHGALHNPVLPLPLNHQLYNHNHNGLYDLNNRLLHNGYNGYNGYNGLAYNGLGLNGHGYNGLGHNGLGYNAYNGLGYNPYGVQPGNSYYIQLPDGRVEETAKIAAQLGYYPVNGLYDPLYRG